MASDAVIAALESSVAADPDNVDVRTHLAGLLVEAGRVDDAVEHCDAALAIDPSHLDALRVAVDAHERAGNTDRAASYRRLVEALGAEPSSEAEAGRRVAETPDGTVTAEIPDTADELLDAWERSEALEEVELGELTAAGVLLGDVGGLDAVKAQLERSFLGPMRNPEMARAFGKAAGGGLLLWGPPGCGKTFLARATAGEMGANFYNVGLADVLDMWIGSSERNLAAVFDAARRNAPCVIFFDEIDALGQKRSHLRTSGATLRGVVNQLLSEMDGVDGDNDGVFILGATNHPWDVDEALLRPGRFDRKLLVLPPDQGARESILRFHLRGKPTADLDLGPIVAATTDYSGADLRLIVETATEAALDRSLGADAVSPITDADLAHATATVGPSIGPWLEAARNYIVYANRGGDYDELERYLADHDSRRRRR